MHAWISILCSHINLDVKMVKLVDLVQAYLLSVLLSLMSCFNSCPVKYTSE